MADKYLQDFYQYLDAMPLAIQSEFFSKTGLDLSSKDSTASSLKRLVDLLIDGQRRHYLVCYHQLLSRSNPAYADDSELDTLGDFLGYRRLPAQKSIIYVSFDHTQDIPSRSTFVVDNALEYENIEDIPADQKKFKIYSLSHGRNPYPLKVEFNGSEVEIEDYTRGSFQEEDAQYRVRLIEAMKKPRGYGTKGDWLQWIREYKQDFFAITIGGASGIIRIYPLNRERVDFIPNDNDVRDLRDFLLKNYLLMGINDILVNKPSKEVIDIKVKTLSPNNSHVKEEVKRRIGEYFETILTPGAPFRLSGLYAHVYQIDAINQGGSIVFDDSVKDKDLNITKYPSLGKIEFS